MTFKNYLCWSPQKIHQVINPDADAEAVSKEIFIAVHTDYPLLFSNSNNRDIPVEPVSAYDFLHRNFLDRNRGDYVQTMVLGESGSGKSHFIKWMSINIPERDDTYVFTIPKARTSLRNIVERIVGLLPPDLADPYHLQLQNSDPITLNERGKIDKLLGSLALAISQDESSTNNETKELEEYLINSLPYIFDDPYLRKSYFAVDNSLISDLVNHVFSNQSINTKAENRREFTPRDIDLGGHDYKNAAVPTQDVLDVISGGQGSKEFDLALKIINRNLDKALTLTLSLTPQQLINMMTDLRKYLYIQGKRLILLVEDLALLQGIDNSLLQALTIPGLQGEERLCELRWAAAVTTGYYLRLWEGVLTRTTFRIEMDRPGSESKKLIGRTGLAKFAGRYLNAIRIGPEKLKMWYQESNFQNQSPPNACDECEHQNICHEGFGATEGYGLYPFNVEALWNMERRADNNMEQCFIPRTFLNEVIRNTLFSHAELLSIGKFPPEKILIGDIKLDKIDRQILQNMDYQNYGRRVALLELWHGKGQIVNLNLIIHEAFSLPLIDIKLLPMKEIKIDEEEIEVKQEKVKSRKNSLYDEIDRWAQGHEMQETLAAELREALFKIFWEYIDWDNLNIDRSFIAGRTGAKAFTQLSFRFIRQTTKPNTPAILIVLPRENKSEDFTKTAIALEGILKFSTSGNWEFTKGDVALFNTLEFLEECSQDIKKQIVNLIKPLENWNVGRAAIELLAIARNLTNSKSDNLSSIISPEPLPSVSMVTSELNKFIERLSKEQINLQKLVQAIYSGKKGGQKGHFIDPREMMETLEILRNNKWQLHQFPPENLFSLYRTVANLYNRAKADFDKAIMAEINARNAWYAKTVLHVAPGEIANDIVEAIAKVRDIMNQSGIQGWNVVDFEKIQQQFRKASPRKLIENNVFNEKIEGNEVLPRIASTQKDQMDNVDVFIQKIEPMLNKGELGLESRRTEYSAAIEPLADVQRRIENAFTNLRTLLEEL